MIADDFEHIAAREIEIRKTEGRHVDYGPSTAFGYSLERWAEYCGVEPRKSGETDASLRQRIMDALTSTSR